MTPRLWATELLLALIRVLNRKRDELLAHRLHDFASQYQRRPDGGWTPPPGPPA